jgi:hypothetical protein
MVPIQSGRLISGNAEAVHEGFGRGRNQGTQGIVSMAGWRNAKAVEMEVGGIRRHHGGCAIGLREFVRMRRGWKREFVLELQEQQITGS